MVRTVTSGELRIAIEGVLGSVPFTPPLTFDYCIAVQHKIQAACHGALVCVYRRPQVVPVVADLLIVEARCGDSRYRLEVPL